MASKIYELSAWEKNNHATITAVQGEALSRTITVRLLDSGGQPIDVTQSSVRLYIIKPDKTKIYKDGTISDAQNGLVDFLLDSQAATAAGTAQCYVIVTQADGGTLIFTGLSLIVTPANFSSIESTDEFSALQTALAKVQDIDSRALKNTTVNGHALTDNIVLTPADINAATAAQGMKADSAVQTSEKGIANGVATLDTNKKLVQMPTAADVGALANTTNVHLDILSNNWIYFTALNATITIPLTFPTGLTADNYDLFIFRVGDGIESSMHMLTKLNAKAIQTAWWHGVTRSYQVQGYVTISSGSYFQSIIRDIVGWQPNEVFISAIFGLRIR